MNLREAEELLPWWVAGTLSEEETRLVQTFIDTGQISQEKIAEFKNLEEAVNTAVNDEPAYNPAILQRVMSQLDDLPQSAVEPKKVRSTATPEKSNQSFFAGVTELLHWSLTPGWAKVTMAAQFAVIAAVLVFASIGNKTVEIEAGTASGPSDSKALVGDLQVIFAPNITELQMRELLQAQKLQIIAGPSSLGMYTIAVDKNVEVEVVQTNLKANPMTIFVEPVPEQ